MRVEELSDHAGDRRRSTTDERNRALAERDKRIIQREEVVADWDRARRERPLWRKVLGVSTSDMRQASERRRAIDGEMAEIANLAERLGHRESALRAGVDGEKVMAEALSPLPDDWLMIRGYANRRGETDCVLVGPGGVWAVEVKNRNARLYAVGNDWKAEKVDRYGNVVRSGPAVDGSGRTWGDQVSHIAGDLEAWLVKNGHDLRVHTAVVLVHHRARIVRSERPGVDLLTADHGDLLRLLASAPPTLDQRSADDVARLVRRDHDFHRSKRRPR